MPISQEQSCQNQDFTSGRKIANCEIAIKIEGFYSRTFIESI